MYLFANQVENARIATVKAMSIVPCAQGNRHVIVVSVVGQYGEDSGVEHVLLVKLVGEDRAFVGCTSSAPTGLKAFLKRIFVELCCDDENNIGIFNVVEHPSRPTFRRRAIDVGMIGDNLHAVLGQPVGEHFDLSAKHSFVGIADKNFWRFDCLGHAGLAVRRAGVSKIPRLH